MKTRAAFVIAGWTSSRPQVSPARPQHQLLAPPLSLSSRSDEAVEDDFDDDDEEGFLLEQLARIEAMEEVLDEFDDNVHDDDDDFADLFTDDNFPEMADLQELEDQQLVPARSAKGLEEALLQGVVPAGAGVGSNCLPGDWGFDPWKLATKDYIGRAQRAVSSAIPGSSIMTGASATTEDRPSALILRDYREAEIRHGRLAMLASIFWPLQEMLDRLLLDESQFGSLVYNGVTLPYIPLLMTAIMLLLGYLDVYTQSIKDVDEIGDAFLPGDCFWDPLSILQGAPDRMKRNMQERELLNGRMAMLAVSLFFWEELRTHQPLISIRGNELLFEPAYEVPIVQSWLDSQFASFQPIVDGSLPIDL